MILSYREVKEDLLPTIIEGIIVDDKNNQPISWTHIYIENSEEESVSTGEGEFKILSWLKPPFVLIIKHMHFKTIRLTVTCNARRILIFMREK